MKYSHGAAFVSLGLLFSLCLSGPARAEQVVFSEIMYHPSGEMPEFLEIQNLTATPFDMALWELDGGVDYRFPDFDESQATASFLKAFERIVVTGVEPSVFREAYGLPSAIRVFGPWDGKLDDNGERVSLKDKNGVTRCTVRYDDKGVWPAAADGVGHSLILKNDSLAIDDYRAWGASPSPGGTPGNPEPALPEEPYPNPLVDLTVGIPFIEYADKWDFHDGDRDLGTSWRALDYNFSHPGWTRENAAGNQGGLYGFENSGVPEPGMRTPLNDVDQLTYYFRKEFNYDGPTQDAAITIDLINDDGAGFWLNGQWVGGVATTASAGHDDTASRTVGNAGEELAVIRASNPPLVVGRNVLAATLKQTNRNSSDAVFAARLSISTPVATSVVLNEVLPAEGGEGFVEFYNPGDVDVDLSGWFLSDDPGNLTQMAIPAGVVVPSGGLATVGFVESGLAISSNTTVFLTQPDGTTVVNAVSTPMPLDGRSLGRKPEGSGSWFLFTGPTPGGGNVSSGGGGSALSINELHVSEEGLVDWVELYNQSLIETSLDGLFLASERDLSDKVALSDSVPGRGYVSGTTAFDVGDADDDLNLYLVDAANTVLDAMVVSLDPARRHVAAFPDGSKQFYRSSLGSQNAPNDPDRETDIVITELMVEPPSGHRDGEYVELHNKGTDAVDLSSWKFDRGIRYTFPSGTVLEPGGYLAVAANHTLTAAAHPQARILGPYEGNLANGGELLRLVDAWDNPADELHFHVGGDWPALAAGLGSSLELRHPEMDNAMASAWVASEESNKSTFQNYVIEERYLQLRTGGSTRDYKELHMHAVGDAHLALRNMELTAGGRNNLLSNDGLEVSTNGQGTNSWLCQGTHFQSRRVGNEFHLISNGHGDVKANRCEIDVLAISQNNTLRFAFQARWISGKPTLVVNTWDRSFGGVVHLPIPSNLGTPGAENSGAISTPAPTVTGLLHSPAVPSSSDAVRVTARVDSALPLSSVRVFHRLDSSGGDEVWQTTPMRDDGTGGDEVAGDGIYSASLTQYQSNDTIAQFYVEAQSGGAISRQPSLSPERPAMWVVDNSSIPTDLRTQRFIISEHSLRALGNAGESSEFNFAFPRLSNNYFNATFISNDRDIIYNCELRKSGSPWTRSSSSDLSRAKWKTPGDRRFRGYSKRAIDNDAGGNRAYHNRIIRYWLYLFGHAANENEFVRVIVNGGDPALREDVEPNANDFLKRNWEDGQLGELYRIDDEWWFEDDWSRQNRDADWSYKDTDEPERYHAEWIKRSRESEYDYSSFVNWVKAVGEDDFTREEIERMADIDMMAANAVVRGWCDDWDTLTRNRGKNGYFLRRHSDNRWMLIQWDSDLTFGNANAAFIGNLAGVRNFFTKPYVEQRVNYYLGQMIDKYTDNSPRLEAWFQCEEDASNSYSSNESTYNSWNAQRVGTARSTIGSAALNEGFDVTTGNGTSTTTPSDTINLSGTSPYNVFEVRAVDHPEAEWKFLTETTWTLSNLQLAQGVNNIVVEGLDAEGNVVGTETFRVTKSGNADPVLIADPKPNSYHVALHDTFELDFTESYDPEGASLAYEWGVAPEADVQLDVQENVLGLATFARPGLYEFFITGTDANGGSQVLSREVSVYALNGWSSFASPLLEDHWSPENVAPRNGSDADTWYSLGDRPGKLTMMVRESAKPFGSANGGYPAIMRTLPESSDWSLHTDVELVSVQTGSFASGVVVEMIENGARVRYSMGMEDGDKLVARRNTSVLSTRAWSDASAVVRVRRGGESLLFDYQMGPGVWQNFASRAVPTDTAMASSGGIYLTTKAVQSIRVEFDYALLVDPMATSPALRDLRISEIMYHPVDGGSEYIELHNRGTESVNLAGVSFEGTRPFEELVFGDLGLAPGEYAVVVADTAAFQATYGDAIRILAQWAGGALSNGGERVVLRDALGNVIHDFTFGDKEPWPTVADGTGPSLEVVDVNGAYEDVSNWSARAGGNGSPGGPPVDGPVDIDTDGDGLTDAQEIALGTSATVADTDGDGMDDGAEVTAGTDPIDKQSLFKILGILRVGQENRVETSWTSVAGKRYVLQASPSLAEAAWSDVGTLSATEAISSLSSEVDEQRQFFRVRLETD